MRLSQKLILFVLAAALLPLSVAGFWSLRQAEVELASRLDHEQRALASAAAEATGTQLTLTLQSLARSAAMIDWSTMTDEERLGALRLLAGQAPSVLAITWYRGPTEAEAPMLSQLPGRPALTITRQALLATLPLESVSTWAPGQGVIAIGPVQHAPAPAGAWLPIGLPLEPKGAALVVLALSVNELRSWLVAHAPAGELIQIVDDEHRLVASSAGDGDLRAGDSREVTSLVPGKLGLSAVVSVPTDLARAPVQALRRTVLGGMGVTVVVLVLVALAFVRLLTSRLERVATTVAAFTRGELSRRVDVGGDDELTELATSFNAMGHELEASRAKLLTWNDELKTQVALATAELKAAQERLLETQKLAALGQLGAGVAHEINNPLVGILGNAQLLLMELDAADPDFSVLRQIEASARRCREITQQLLRFSQHTGEVALMPVELNAFVERVLVVERPRLTEAGITLDVVPFAEPVRVDADAEALEHVLFQLCSNARTAMKESKVRTLTVRVLRAGFEVIDTGKGIAPEHLTRVFEPFFTTKDVWSNVGLGLSVSYRIITQHHGAISVQSTPGQGARFTVTLQPVGSQQPAPSSNAGVLLE